MAYCPKCGKTVQEGQRFCASCGAPQPVFTEPQRSVRYAAETDKAFAIISYIGFLSVISYFVAKDSPFARFHALQGINLFILEMICWIGGGTIRVMLSWIPVFGSAIAGVIGLVSLGFLALSIVGIVNAAQGEMKELPVIGAIRIVTR